MTSYLAFILIGLMVGAAGSLLLEKNGRLFSIRYLLTALALSTLFGMIVTLFSRGTSGFFIVTQGAVIAALLTSVAGVLLLKLTAKPLNSQTDADIPWDGGGKGGSSDNSSKDKLKDSDEGDDDNEDSDEKDPEREKEEYQRQVHQRAVEKLREKQDD